ncbi:unnamed protein product, partial [Staurois parvus]
NQHWGFYFLLNKLKKTENVEKKSFFLVSVIKFCK